MCIGCDEDSSRFAKAAASRGWCKPGAGSETGNIPSEPRIELTVEPAGRPPLSGPHMLVCRNGWSTRKRKLSSCYWDGSFLNF